MNKTPLVGYGAEAIGTAMSLMTASRIARGKLTPEERKANRDRYEFYKNERIRKAKIIANICPTCEGKLVRGKKNKKNDYKRDWVCSACEEVHTI